MKVCVLSGSPKGENSITYQTLLYIKNSFTDDEFMTLHVGQRIHSYEKDMSEAIAAIKDSDMLLFVYPVYTFIAPSQLHRFIELLKETGIDISGKYAAQISTSKHFYDTTAHKYIEENCYDLGLKYVGGLSADMEDLLKKSGRKDAYDFWKLVKWKVKNNITGVTKTPVIKSDNASGSGTIYERAFTENASKKQGNEVVIVASLSEGDISLKNMIDDFCAVYPYTTKVININKYAFSGGCLGCFHCATTGKCIYKDNFDEYLRNEIQTGAAIVYAFTIKDHCMGFMMKMFDDRQFCNGHRTVTMGRPVGYIINGDLESEANLKMIIEGRAQVGGNFLAGTASDNDGIISLAKMLVYSIKHKTSQPAMFLGVGGMKIFRDLIWEMQGMMKADHKFYKEHGFYDFPQKKVASIMKMKLVGLLISNKKVQSKLGSKMTEEMLKPYKKYLPS